MDPIEYREQVYEVLSDAELSVEQKIDRALEIGVEHLDLSLGFFTRIQDGRQEIKQSTGDHPLIQPGESCPLDSAYCQRTIEIESPLAVQDSSVSTAISDSAVETFGLGAYIGARVVVNGETYGTICFADPETRDVTFSDSESFFVELTARLVGQLLEREAYEAEITAREREVRTQEEIYRAVVDASFDLIFQIDTEGQFTYLSPTVEQLLGYPSSQYIGEPFTAMLPDAETIELAEGIYERVMAGETIEQEYFPLEHRSESPVPVDIRVTPLYAGQVPSEERTPTDIVGVQGMARDARDRQRRQRLIRVLNRVLRHNLRNDMSVIDNYASILADRLTGENHDYARKIAETSEQLTVLSETAQKLEQNLEEPPEHEVADIVPVVRRVATQIEDRYPDASLQVTTPDSAVAKTAPRLETALWELTNNAATHAGQEPSIEITVLENDYTVVIRIEDDGPGLPEQEKEVLVCGEETPLVHGSGLGLWLVHWIVETLDGSLRVQEHPDTTAIEVTLERPAES